jgi:transglutaminase-like putative cysteine protease
MERAWFSPNGRREKAPLLEVKSRFMTRDRAIDVNVETRRRCERKPGRAQFFRNRQNLSARTVSSPPRPKVIVMGLKNDADKAKAIYEWIVDNTFRDAKVKGCGIGDISTMLESGYLGGKCADLNALYVGLCPRGRLAGPRCLRSACRGILRI